MLWVAFGRWSSSSGNWFIRTRIYSRRGKWTPFVRVRWRYSWAQKLAWMLPRAVVYHCAVKVISHATTGKYGSQVVPELTAMEALNRWYPPGTAPSKEMESGRSMNGVGQPLGMTAAQPVQSINATLGESIQALQDAGGVAVSIGYKLGVLPPTPNETAKTPASGDTTEMMACFIRNSLCALAGVLREISERIA